MVTSLQSSRSAQNLNNVEDEAKSLHKVQRHTVYMQEEVAEEEEEDDVVFSSILNV